MLIKTLKRKQRAYSAVKTIYRFCCRSLYYQFLYTYFRSCHFTQRV